MVGLGEVDEFEVEAKGPCELIGSGKIERADAIQSLLEMGVGRGLVGCSALRGFGVAAGYGSAAKRFDSIVERAAGLFAKDFAKKHAKRADIAPQGRFLDLAGRGLKLGKTLRPVSWGPKRRHK